MKTSKVNKNLSMIAAIDLMNGIGSNNELLCSLPNDMKHFRKLTVGHIVIMGRKTYEAIGKQLPNRINIVITSKRRYKAPGCLIAHSLPAALKLMPNDKQAFIIGGSSIYEQAMPYVSTLYLTKIYSSFDNVDSYFVGGKCNIIDKYEEDFNFAMDWQLLYSEMQDNTGPHCYEFCKYIRTNQNVKLDKFMQGYWAAIQNICLHDKMIATDLITQFKLSYSDCISLMKHNDFRADILIKCVKAANPIKRTFIY